MKVAMLVRISGGRGDGTQWPDLGVPFHVDDAEGAHLCAGGLAYPVAEEPYTETRTVYDAGDVLPEGVSLAFNDTGDAESLVPPVPKPIVNSPKAAWVEHAVARGAGYDEAHAMKKSELIARYGNGA